MSLRWAVLGIIPLALVLAHVTNRARNQRLLVAAVQRAGGRLGFDYQVKNGRFVNAQPTKHLWLRRHLGPEYVQEIVSIGIRAGAGPLDKQLTQQLARAGRIQYVHLGGTQNACSVLAALEGQNDLVLVLIEEADLSDQDLASLRNQTNVQELYLSGTSISDAGLAQLSRLTHLRSLVLSHTQVGDAGMVFLGGLTQLDTLVLDHTEVGDEGLAHLRNLRSLTRLNLSATRVTDAGLAHLKSCSALSDLDLTELDITGVGLRHLQNVPSLRLLHLSSPRLGQNAMDTVTALKELVRANPLLHNSLQFRETP